MNYILSSRPYRDIFVMSDSNKKLFNTVKYPAILGGNQAKSSTDAGRSRQESQG